MMLSLGLFTLFALQSTIAETPGICSVAHVVTRQMHVIDGIKRTWSHQIYNTTIEREECCSGYKVEKRKPLSCTPICDPACENSDCMGPDLCVCHPGHVMINNSSNTCLEVCESCVNGNCDSIDDLECTCFSGYRRDPKFPHICDPICSPDCVNAECAHPFRCECYDGYKQHPYIPHICIPRCDQECVFGTCTDPGVCECLEGYISDGDLHNICLPFCNRTCVNGYCYAPNQCKCHDGFQVQEWNPYLCLPETPEVEDTFSSCQLNLPKAVKYDEDSDCFLIKENISLSVVANCGLIKIFCSQPDNCPHGECVLNFWCSAGTNFLDGRNLIHCASEADGFQPYSSKITSVINFTGIEWIDVVLMVHKFENLSSTEFKENISKEWTLQPLSKEPVCGNMHFALQMSEFEAPIVSSHINQPLMLWMNVILICGFVLLVVVGVGGFLWARHRRLKDPRNYREDMTPGYENQCYDNNATELVSDDDSEHYSEAPMSYGSGISQ